MKNNQEEIFDELLRDSIKSTLLDSPSINFSKKVMSSVMNVSVYKSVVYKPLISKNAWLIIILLFTVLFLYFAIYNTNNSAQSLYDINFNFVGEYFYQYKSLFSFSAISNKMYLIFSVVLLIQLILIKNYLNRRFA